ncbi:MAG: hypothetical protein SFW35_14420 [Chitinophagales bacterium]|nr:hypothetical protein [Chitinophagales bacterium]
MHVALLALQTIPIKTTTMKSLIVAILSFFPFALLAQMPGLNVNAQLNMPSVSGASVNISADNFSPVDSTPIAGNSRSAVVEVNVSDTTGLATIHVVLKNSLTNTVIRSQDFSTSGLTAWKKGTVSSPQGFVYYLPFGTLVPGLGGTSLSVQLEKRNGATGTTFLQTNN